MVDDDECGAVGRMKIGRVNLSTKRNPTPSADIHQKSHMT
jgi:hypothetical protein